MKLLLGSRLYVDFPTVNAIIYPRKVVEKALAAPELREALDNRMMAGGIYDGPHLTPKDGIITHVVTDILIYNDEVVAELDVIESPEVEKLLDTIKHKKAAIITKIYVGQGGPGSIIREILGIECVHIKEDQSAQLNRSDPEN